MQKITVQRFIEWIKAENIPTDTEIDIAVGGFPCPLRRMVYCHDTRNITAIPMTEVLDKCYENSITSIITDN